MCWKYQAKSRNVFYIPRERIKCREKWPVAYLFLFLSFTFFPCLCFCLFIFLLLTLFVSFFLSFFFSLSLTNSVYLIPLSKIFNSSVSHKSLDTNRVDLKIVVKSNEKRFKFSFSFCRNIGARVDSFMTQEINLFHGHKKSRVDRYKGPLNMTSFSSNGHLNTPIKWNFECVRDFSSNVVKLIFNFSSLFMQVGW